MARVDDVEILPSVVQKHGSRDKQFLLIHAFNLLTLCIRPIRFILNLVFKHKPTRGIYQLHLRLSFLLLASMVEQFIVLINLLRALELLVLIVFKGLHNVAAA